MGVEIERKYLIKMPNIDELSEKYILLKQIKINQTYLVRLEKEIERRIRREEIKNEVFFFYTEKSGKGIKRKEEEKEISFDLYSELMKEKDINLNEIVKNRYVYDYKGHKFEIDIYPFWSDYAVFEVELNSEDENIDMLPDLKIVREVTEDKRFKNNSLAENTNII